MNKFFTITIVILLLALLFGQKLRPKEGDEQVKYLNEKINYIITKNDLIKTKAIIIIPRAGCSGCIDNSILYLKDNFKDIDNVHVVFTNINDRKLLKLKAGKEMLSSTRVHIDNKNYFSVPITASAYPQLVKIRNGNVESVINNFDVPSIKYTLDEIAEK